MQVVSYGRFCGAGFTYLLSAILAPHLETHDAASGAGSEFPEDSRHAPANCFADVDLLKKLAECSMGEVSVFGKRRRG